MFCRNCGKEMSDGAEFCPNCGRSKNGSTKKFNLPIMLILGVVALVVIFILLRNVLQGGGKNNLSEQINNVRVVTDYNSDTTVEQMDTVTFGSYPQSDVSGRKKDPIEWIVLENDKTNNKVLLLSKYILDSKNYNDSGADCTWETCSLRKWLNNTFYNSAFSKSEKNSILISNLINADNKYEETNGVNNTNDNVFCLSNGECDKFFGNFYTTYLSRNIVQPGGFCKPFCAQGTNYARNVNINGGKLWTADEGSFFGNSQFWCRTVVGNFAMTVGIGGLHELKTSGMVNTNGLTYNGIGVRPAIWVKYDNSISNKSGGDGWRGDAYYKNGSQVFADWVQEGKDWYYIGSDGKKVKGNWIELNNAWYYLESNGKMAKNKWIENNYYVNENGEMLKNTTTPDGKLVGADGSKVKTSDRNIYIYKKIKDKNSLDSYNLERELKEYFPLGISFLARIEYKLDSNGNLWVKNEDGSAMYGWENTYIYIFYVNGNTDCYFKRHDFQGYSWDNGETTSHYYPDKYEYTKNGMPITKQEFDSIHLPDNDYYDIIMKNQ